MAVQSRENIEEGQLDAETVLLTVRGPVDRRSAFHLQRSIGAAVRAGRLRAIVDLSRAGEIAPGVLAALLHARRRLLAIGGDLTLVAPESSFTGGCPLPVEPTIAHAHRQAPFAAIRRATVGVVGPLRRAITGWTAGIGADAHTQDAVALAASEAITNAVVHAYREAPEPGTVSVTGEIVAEGRVRVTVTDKGCGMKPRVDSAGLGLGLPLIAQLADNLEIDSRVDEGTRIAMDFEQVSGR